MSTKASVTDAATPANTPLNVAPISSRGQVAEGGRPTVTTVDEEEEGGEQQGGEQGGLEGGNPASVLARVSSKRFLGKSLGRICEGGFPFVSLPK